MTCNSQCGMRNSELCFHILRRTPDGRPYEVDVNFMQGMALAIFLWQSFWVVEDADPYKICAVVVARRKPLHPTRLTEVSPCTLYARSLKKLLILYTNIWYNFVNIF